MISKEKFIEYMSELKALCDAENELNDVLQKIGSDNTLWFDKYETLIVNVLRDMFNDQENDWIGYSIYELDWFENYEDGMITDKDGNDIPLRDTGDLYNLLIWSLEN